MSNLPEGLVFHTAACHLAPLVEDRPDDIDFDPNIGLITADVLFTSNLAPGDVLRLPQIGDSPPIGLIPVSIPAVIREDGLLCMAASVDVGGGLIPVRLLGNSPALGLEAGKELEWSFAFSNIRIDGKPTRLTVAGGSYIAPNQDTTIYLTDYMRRTSGKVTSGVIRIAPTEVQQPDPRTIRFGFGGVLIPGEIDLSGISAGTWDTLDGKPAVVAAGDDPAAARASIGAGASAQVVAGSDAATLAESMTMAANLQRPLAIPAGKFLGSLYVPRNQAVAGAAGGRTVIEPAPDAPGIVYTGTLSSQYGSLTDVMVAYATMQTRAQVNASGVMIDGGMQFSTLRGLQIVNAHTGFDAHEGVFAHQFVFNNRLRDIRILNCWKGFRAQSNGSGQLVSNLYVSAPGRSSMLWMVASSDFYLGVDGLNLEWTNVRDCAIDLTYAANVQLRSVHIEGIGIFASGTTPLDGALAGALIKTSGQGVLELDQINLDTCHFGAYMVKPNALTRTGTTARAVVNLMGFDNKARAGHGFEVGDSIYIEGVDAASAGFGGAKTVTAVGLDWVEFTVAENAPALAGIADGSDCVTVHLGDQPMNSVCLLATYGSTGRVSVNSIHIRDMRIIAHSAAKRARLFRWLKSGSGASMDVRHVSYRSQRPQAFWREAAPLVGYSRDTNGVATLYFQRPHNLEPGSVLHVTGFADATFNGIYTSVSPVSRWSVAVPSPGVARLATPDTGYAVLRYRQIESVSRAGNYATITTTTPHELDFALADGCGCRVILHTDDATFRSTANGVPSDVLVQQIISPTSFLVRSVGPEVATKPDGGSVQLLEGGTTTGPLTDGGESFGDVRFFDGMDEYQTVLLNAKTPAQDSNFDDSKQLKGWATASCRTVTPQRADQRKNMIEIVGVQPISHPSQVSSRDPRLLVTGRITSTGTVSVDVSNLTSDPIAIPTGIVRFRVV